MAKPTSEVQKFVDVTEAALSLGQATYSGTVAPAARRAQEVEKFVDVTEAALSLGQATYSGTVAPAARRELLSVG